MLAVRSCQRRGGDGNGSERALHAAAARQQRARRSHAAADGSRAPGASPRPDGYRVHRAALPQWQPVAPTGAVPDAGDGELGAANARHSRLRSRGSAPLPARPPSARLRRRRRRRARRLPRQLLKN